MGALNIFKGKKPGAKAAPTKRKTRSESPKPTSPPKAKRQRKPLKKLEWGKFFRRIRAPKWRIPWWLRPINWREIPWWSKLLMVLGMVGVGFAIWFAVQSSLAPPPEYRLSTTVNPASGGQVNLNPSYDNYRKGTQVTLTTTAAADYEFVSWSGDASGVSPTVTITMDSDKEITANFQIIQYGLTAAVSPPEGGRVSPSSGTYDIGSPVTLTATASADYEFVSWSGDASRVSPTITITMDSDKEVTANFQVVQYDLATTANPPEGGQVSPSSGTYDSGSPVTLTATASADYEFVSWSGDASGVSPTVTITMDSNKEITANFVATVQEIRLIMPTGISGSAVVYTNDLERGEIIEGFVELTGEYRGQDWSFDWTFEIIGPEGRKIDYWEGHWVKDNHHNFSFKAQYSGTYRIRVRHNSLTDKDLLIKIIPMGWQ